MVSRTNNPGKRAGYEAELHCPPFPVALTYLWNAYLRLSRRAGSNGFGKNPIGWADLDAFIRLSGVALSPWEIEIIEMLDDLSHVDYSKQEID